MGPRSDEDLYLSAAFAQIYDRIDRLPDIAAFEAGHEMETA